MTIYAGDMDHKKLIVVANNSPKYIDIQYKPLRTALMKKESILLVGCFGCNQFFTISRHPLTFHSNSCSKLDILFRV